MPAGRRLVEIGARVLGFCRQHRGSRLCGRVPVHREAPRHRDPGQQGRAPFPNGAPERGHRSPPPFEEQRSWPPGAERPRARDPNRARAPGKQGEGGPP
eukprot:892396-Pyramimonas_sp.AAC.1